MENISGGEKQKIGLVRSLLKKGNVLILDEPTSALDKNSVENLKNYLVKNKKDKIIIIVTHDDELIDISDFILNFNDLVENKEYGV